MFTFVAVGFSSGFFFFQVGSYVAQAGIDILILLPLTPECLHLSFENSF